MSRRYDYLVVGAGLFGATFAYKAKQAGKRCLVIDKRPHLGGNIYCENIEGINVHNIYIINSKEELYKAVDLLIEDHALRTSLEENAKAYYREYVAPEKVIESIVNKLRDI